MASRPMSVRLPKDETLDSVGAKLHAGEKVIFTVELWNVGYVIVLDQPPFISELGFTIPSFISKSGGHGGRTPCTFTLKDGISALWVDGLLPS